MKHHKLYALTEMYVQLNRMRRTIGLVNATTCIPYNLAANSLLIHVDDAIGDFFDFIKPEIEELIHHQNNFS